MLERIADDAGLTEDAYEALRMGMDALEKQVEKKKHKYVGYRCVCGEEVAKNQRFCEYCGQKLMDWDGK